VAPFAAIREQMFAESSDGNRLSRVVPVDTFVRSQREVLAAVPRNVDDPVESEEG
jgi:hypothetical protein